MNFFKKANKNKTASAAPTPAQTPRASMDDVRPSTSTMTKLQKQVNDAELLHRLMVKAMSGGHNAPSALVFPTLHSPSKSQQPLSQANSRSRSHQTSQTTAQIPAMPFFKSNKNKTASAATTPAQTPRSSMQEQRAKPHKMTQEEALEKLMRVTMGDAASGPYIR
ncbi:hypothetical protein BG003_009045 [Podila horticola]|nr:hypothetical protein BG003_009045 [Podila horticola]